MNAKDLFLYKVWELMLEAIAYHSLRRISEDTIFLVYW